MDSLRTVAIVQARMGSTRLPGKVLLDVGGESMLARVVRRVRRAASLDDLVVATTAAPADAAVVDECRRLGVASFLGDEHDVLDRFYRAAQAHSAGAVVRITADCPLIDPGLIDRVVDDFRVWAPDYASNVLERTYPRGLDAEVISFPALERAWHEASEPYQRAHVTPYFYVHPDLFRLLSVTASPADYSAHRWTVDTADDLSFVREVVRRLAEPFSWTDVLDLLAREPALADINRAVRQKALHEG
jgi:spore coat polysaccharide biosynthesis protein SpsF